MKTRSRGALALLYLLVTAHTVGAATTTERIDRPVDARRDGPRPIGDIGPTLNAVVGLWHGVATISTPNLEINAGGRGYDEYSIQRRVGVQHYLFLPDGTYTNDIPDFGIDASTLRRGSVYGRGVYRVDGNLVTMKAAAPGARARMLRIVNGVLETPEGNLKRRPAIDGITIDGSFLATDPSADGPAVRRQQQAVTFHSDGRFSDQGAINVIRNARRGGRPLSFQPGGAGRYFIANHTLTLSYDDGRVTRLTVFYLERSAIGLAQVRLPRL
jgi:hypothetical protein